MIGCLFYVQFQEPMPDPRFQSKGGPDGARRTSSVGASSNMRKVSTTTNIVDDLTSIFGGNMLFSTVALFPRCCFPLFLTHFTNLMKCFCLQKVLHQLENSKKWKEKVKKEEERDWNDSEGPRSVQYVLSAPRCF